MSSGRRMATTRRDGAGESTGERAGPAGSLESRLELIKMATRQARRVMRGSRCDSATMSEALLRLIQQHLFAVLVELESGGPGVKLEAIARSVAQLARASLMSREYLGERARKPKATDKASSAEHLRELLLEPGPGGAEEG